MYDNILKHPNKKNLNPQALYILLFHQYLFYMLISLYSITFPPIWDEEIGFGAN